MLIKLRSTWAARQGTQRGVIARRSRCQEIRSIDDLITYDLDIRRFAEEAGGRGTGFVPWAF